MIDPSPNPHDALCRLLFDDPVCRQVWVRETLGPDLVALLADTPPRLVDGTFIDDALRESRSDRLLEVDLADGGIALLYVLMEHKSRPDPGTALQVLGYQVRIWKRWAGDDPARLRALPPILPVVIHHGTRPWREATSVLDSIDGPPAVRARMASLRFQLVDLGPIPYRRLSAEPRLRAGLGALKLGAVGRASRAELEALVGDLPDREVLERQVLGYIGRVIDLTPAQWQEVVRAAKPAREEEIVATLAQHYIDQGMAQGMTQGMAQGRAEGGVEMLLTLLEARFGAVPSPVRGRLSALAPERCAALVRRAARAEHLEEVLDALSEEDRD